jgi:hypothetical protein
MGPSESELLVSLTLASNEVVSRREPALIAVFERSELNQHRTPKAHTNQKNIPGLFWVSQLNELIWYENRLEMFILKQIDFSLNIKAILPQPFELHFKKDGKSGQHVPDFLVWLKDGQRLLLNVRSKRTIGTQTCQRMISVCTELCDSIGWNYSTMRNPDAIFLANLNWLAGYRRTPPNFKRLAADIINSFNGKRKIGEILIEFTPPALLRPVLFHLLWLRYLDFDNSELLTNDTEVWIAKQI